MPGRERNWSFVSGGEVVSSHFCPETEAGCTSLPSPTRTLYTYLLKLRGCKWSSQEQHKALLSFEQQRQKTLAGI